MLLEEATQPRYRQVYSALRDQLEAQTLAPHTRLPPDRELVTRFQVSRLTIAKALSQLVAEGYLVRRPGSGTYVTEWAQRRARSTPLHVALLIPYEHDEFITSLMKAISETLYEHAGTLQFFDSSGRTEKEAEYLKRLREHPAQGVIAFPISMRYNRDLYAALAAAGQPLVFLDRYFPDLDADRVVSDNQQGAYLATRALIARGHRVIAHLLPAEAPNTALIERRLGYERALLEAELPVSSGLLREVRETSPRRPDRPHEPRLRCADVLRDWRQRAEPPTAVFCANDWVLQSCLQALRRAGTRVPGEMAVAGFCDGTAWLAHVDEPFTAVTQQTDLMGRRAVDLLLAQIRAATPADRAAAPPQHVSIVPRLWQHEGHA